jgi:solute carrier family 25 uncoupling protein 8/9
MQTILKIPGFTDNVVTHLFAGMGAGFFAVCIGSPVDVVNHLYPYKLSSVS